MPLDGVGGLVLSKLSGIAPVRNIGELRDPR